MPDYTHMRLEDVPDQAAAFGFGETGTARFGREAVGATETGFAMHTFNPGRRSDFGHRHEAAEEVAVVLEGSGRLKLDDDLLDVARHDVVRIAPQVMRAWEAGPDGLTVLVFGPHHEGDGEMDPTFWPAS